ncbi:hypothetical protein HU200_057416 [Digitaria exilis]|uniref:Alpha/beta hydrolase fold-3 domain-containing protein n=1 Tax=Digitaria exilis TaxID=1010633 RepID=A0A835E4D1_9POAL|nr:hypothetical protein HU200_057416 [Digitaria exilis]
MASSDAAADEVTVELLPFIRVYKSGRIERLIVRDTVPASLHDTCSTGGVASKDVIIDPTTNVSVRLYLPPTATGDNNKLPVVVYFHGGGFMVESSASVSYHRYLNALSARAGALAVSVDYRRVPEHRLPAAYDDSWAALLWAVAAACVSSAPGGSAPEPWLAQHGDPTRVFLAGDSAGANIAHNVAIRAAAEGHPAAIRGVMLMHPYFWDASNTMGPKLEERIRNEWRFVTGNPDARVDDPRLSPTSAAAPSLAMMPTARVLVAVAGDDFLASKGRAYHAALLASGWRGEAELEDTPGEVHVFHLQRPGTEAAEKLMDPGRLGKKPTHYHTTHENGPGRRTWIGVIGQHTAAGMDTEASSTPAAAFRSGRERGRRGQTANPTLPAAFFLGLRKRSFGELGGRAEFVAGKDGAYDSVEMPKRFNFPEALDGEDARTTAVYVRAMILLSALLFTVLCDYAYKRRSVRPRPRCPPPVQPPIGRLRTNLSHDRFRFGSAPFSSSLARSFLLSRPRLASCRPPGKPLAGAAVDPLRRSAAASPAPACLSCPPRRLRLTWPDGASSPAGSPASYHPWPASPPPLRRPQPRCCLPDLTPPKNSTAAPRGLREAIFLGRGRRGTVNCELRGIRRLPSQSRAGAESIVEKVQRVVGLVAVQVVRIGAGAHPIFFPGQPSEFCSERRRPTPRTPPNASPHSGPFSWHGRNFSGRVRPTIIFVSRLHLPCNLALASPLALSSTSHCRLAVGVPVVEEGAAGRVALAALGMASRTRSCARCLASLVFPFLFFSSLIYLSTRHPLLEIAVREEAAAGKLRLVVGRAAATVQANASVTVDAVAQTSQISAVATGNDGDDSVVLADSPPASGDDANVSTEKVQVSDIAAVAAEDGGAKVVVTSDAPGSDTNGAEADTVVFDFRPYVLVYKSGRVHRFHGTDTIPAGVDALTGVASKDVATGGVSARLYMPPKSRRVGKAETKKLPVLLYFHGGAFVIESPFSPLYHAFLNTLVSKAGVVAVAVNYRLAPEHPLPAAYDDAWAALKWTVSNCLSGPEPWLANHGNATHIFLAGDSAGGNIAHNLAMRAGAERRALPGEAYIASVILMNPYFWGKEPVGSEPREQWVRDGLEQTWALVCGGRFGIDDPRVNPLAASPGAWRAMAGERVLVTVAGRDNFRDRAAAYAEGLRKSGWRGEVETYVTEGEAHVHFVGNPRSDKAEKETDKVAEFITRSGRG